MKKGKSKLVVVGDRILIEPDEGEEKTAVGLYVPRWVAEKESVQGGRVIATGPGMSFPDFKEMDDEPWRPVRREARHVPLQTRVGDYAIFLRKAAVEIKFEGKNYLVVPEAAILVLMRDDGDYDGEDFDER
jgi:co-chaperonin GroES (HSP10)